MFPIVLDLADLPVALVGNGAQALRRLALLDEDHAAKVQVFAPAPSPALLRSAGARLERRWPTAAEIAEARLLFIANDVEASAARDLVAVARASGTLVNAEDRPELCNFHSPAMVRRGDLLLTVSTGGRSPGLAHRLGHFLAGVFGPEWQARLEELSTLRAGWREAGADAKTIGAWTDAWVDRRAELPDQGDAAAIVARTDLTATEPVRI